MEWKLMGSTFLVIFLAELGDKTQLATFALAASPTSRLAVFLGASVALIATSAIAVLLGEAVGRVVPEVWLKRMAGALFIVLGVLFLVGRDTGAG
jgi:putative Ca2+/H+ antiporter (TMEM165/GDT1 family)